MLAARDEAHLAHVEAQLAELGACFVAVREPDPPWSGALMALGVEPVADRKGLASALACLPVLKTLNTK